jgi:mRNA interferase RelE/StbE
MEVEFLSSFLKDLGKIQSKVVKSEVAEILEEVEAASNLSSIRNIKKLKGHKNAYRIRSGDYRIGIFAEKNRVEFARILHRKDIYKIFP